MIGAATEQDIARYNLPLFTATEDAYAISLEIEEPTTMFENAITVITTVIPKIGDMYSLTLEKVS